MIYSGENNHKLITILYIIVEMIDQKKRTIFKITNGLIIVNISKRKNNLNLIIKLEYLFGKKYESFFEF